MQIKYVASKTMRRFHQSDAFVRALIGPIGSGKSVACVVEMLIKSLSQQPDASLKRKTRWVVVRNTYRELIDTTIKTFFDWFPEHLGIFKKMDMKFCVSLPLKDGTTAEIEFLFRALDKPDDIKKLLSLEVTGGWLNECREIPKQIMDMLIGRLGRYPRMIDGKGATWFGLIMDTNPPDSDHWFYKLFEEDRPDGYEIFHQPSGVSPEAENIPNLPHNYYKNMRAGKDIEWINVYIHGQYGFVMDGKPVYPEYKDDIHFSPNEVIIPKNALIYIGLDFGLTPAATFGYLTPANRWIIFDELVSYDMGAANFAKMLKKHINHNYPQNKIEIYGDPSGDQRAQTDESTPFQVLDANGIVAWPAYTNDPIIRREAVAGAMCRMDFAGNPGFLIGPKAILTRKAHAGGYKYKRVQITGADRFMDKPDKNKYSHVAESLQYLMLGAGEGSNVVGGYGNIAIDYAKSDRRIV